jgi:hypothetical protein
MADSEVGEDLKKVFEYHTFEKKSLSQFEEIFKFLCITMKYFIGWSIQFIILQIVHVHIFLLYGIL